jgi:hypothetical protein
MAYAEVARHFDTETDELSKLIEDYRPWRELLSPFKFMRLQDIVVTTVRTVLRASATELWEMARDIDRDVSSFGQDERTFLGSLEDQYSGMRKKLIDDGIDAGTVHNEVLKRLRVGVAARTVRMKLAESIVPQYSPLQDYLVSNRARKVHWKNFTGGKEFVASVGATSYAVSRSSF